MLYAQPRIRPETHEVMTKTDHLISSRRPDLVIVNKKKQNKQTKKKKTKKKKPERKKKKEKRTCRIVDFAVSRLGRAQSKIKNIKTKREMNT